MSRKKGISSIFEEQPVKAVPYPVSPEKGRQTLFRMSDPARKQLDHLGVELGHSLQSLLTEAVNDLFAKHGKPPIA